MNWKNTQVKLKDLRPWEQNPRQSTKKQAKAILESFERFGQVETVAIGPNNEVYDGHQRLGALMTLYGPEYQIDARQCDRELKDAERQALVITLHAGAKGEWDWDMLGNWDADLLLSNGVDKEMLKELTNDAKNIQALLKSIEPPTEDVEPEIDKADELRDKWGVELGQMWQLGEHRIICGDCTDATVVDRVMDGIQAEMCWTDPPWNVAYGSNLKKDNQKGYKVKKIENDNLGAAFGDFAQKFCDQINRVLLPGAMVYMAMSAQEWGLIMNVMEMSGFHWSSTIIWNKDHPVLSRKDYHTKYEPLWYGWKEGSRLHPLEDRKQSDVWDIKRPVHSEEHPTMKPVELIVRSVINSSKEGNIIFEPFSGSGSTILACEQTNRKCRAIELSPAYVAVALERWHQLTGEEPVML